LFILVLIPFFLKKKKKKKRKEKKRKEEQPYLDLNLEINSVRFTRYNSEERSQNGQTKRSQKRSEICVSPSDAVRLNIFPPLAKSATIIDG
jgi:hypothetical protein